jgi:hypothetical protein
MDFLPILRFKDCFDNDTYTYRFEIFEHPDSTYSPIIDFHHSHWYKIVTWQGDTLTSIPSLGHGVYKGNPNTYSDYDPSIISFTEDEIKPLKVGKTSLTINYPGYSDTVVVKVTRKNSRLEIAQGDFN